MDFLKYKDEIIKNNGLKEDWFILGIDLGTTNSVVSYFSSKSNTAIPVDISMGFGKIPMPSVVQLRENNSNSEWIIGEEAYQSMGIYHESTIRSIKRKMGTEEKVKFGDSFYYPEEISAKILQTIIDTTKKINPKAEIVGIVIAVPHDFSDIAKNKTIEALKLSGYGDKLISLIEEPRAIALSYSIQNEIEKDENILIFDFGGGTLDLTLFNVNSKDDKKIEVQVIKDSGKANHGGDNVDQILLNKFYEFIYDEKGISTDELTKTNIAELKMKAIDTKERLSGAKNYRVPFTFLVPPFIKNVTREDFLSYINDFIEETRNIVLNTLISTKIGTLSVYDVDKIILCGGSSKMPWVKELLIDIFHDEKKIYVSNMPATDISVGATLFGAIKMNAFDAKDIITIDKGSTLETNLPYDIGFLIENNGIKSFHTMIKKGTPYKIARKEQIFTINADNEDDMTKLNLTVLKRMYKDDDISKCAVLNEFEFLDLPKRPSGMTKLLLTITASPKNELTIVSVEDLGYNDRYKKSGYYKTLM